MRDPAAHAERGAEASLMRHKTLTGEDRRGAGPTAACQQILRAPQENAAQGACKDRKKQSLNSVRVACCRDWPDPNTQHTQ